MKKTAVIVIFLFVLQLLPIEGFYVFADEQPMPTNLEVDKTDGQPIIGYTVEKGNYARLKWEAPAAWRGQLQYYELYCREDDGSYEQYGGQIEKNQTAVELEHLKAGVVYHAYIEAVHEHFENGSMVSKDKSLTSNEVIFMTDMEVSVKPAANNMLEIQWNNISYNDASVAYDVYISESGIFAETPVIHITADDIGDSKPIKNVNGKLVYTTSGLKPGTVYYVKIKPWIDDERITYLDESKLAAGYTNIAAGASKISDEWWKLEWNPVTNTNLGEGEDVLYKIKRCLPGDVEKDIAATKDTSILVKLPEEGTYYRIQADIVNGFGETINVVSLPFYLQEGDIPAAPAVPEIEEELSGEYMQIGDDSVKILWRAPVTPTGEIDSNVFYDIWMLEKPGDISNSAIAPIASNLHMTQENYVYEMIGNQISDKVVGYKYILNGLQPDKVYYLKMIAKKTYGISEGGTIVNRDYTSESALKTLVTLPEGSIDQPLASLAPPLKVKTQEVNGNTVQCITHDTITLQWKNTWHEIWDDINDKWVYTAPENLEQFTVQGYVYRLVQYDENVKFSVGYEVYTDNFDFSRLLETTSQMPCQFTDIPNSEASDTVEFDVSGLNPNTPYVMWIRAYRSDALKSGLSDPVIATTAPDYKVPLRKPEVPDFNYKYEGDTYAEVGWNIKDGYYYTVKYSNIDDINQAEKTIEISPEDLKNNIYYTVNELKPDTAYYFWIKARIEGSGNTSSESGWSDSYSIKTKPFSPPDRPNGFGLKKMDEPVGKDYIFYEWDSINGLEYTLEISKNSDFTNSTSYKADNADEYKLEGLDSNTRYYARLYAYDPQKELASKFTSTVAVKTKRSYDEYYADVDTDVTDIAPVKPELDEDDDDIGNIDATGIKAERFIEQIYQDSRDDFEINFAVLSEEESSGEIEKSISKIPYQAFKALAQLKKRLVLNNGNSALIISPEITDNEQLKEINEKAERTSIKITLQEISSPSTKPTNGSIISDVWKVAFEVNSDGVERAVDNVESSARIRIPYTDSKWFDQTVMSGHVYDCKDKSWSGVNTSHTFNNLDSEGFVYANIPHTCEFAIIKSASQESRFTDISGSYAGADIKAVTAKYDLKSIKGNLFLPSRNITKAEAVKILLDVMEYEYDDKYLEAAKKAQIISYIDAANIDGDAAREEAASMLVRTYEIMTGSSVQGDISLSGIKDLSSVNKNLLSGVKLAVQSGILSTDSWGYIRPKNALTRAEMMVMLKKMLEKAERL